MKELLTLKKWTVAILDDRNYILATKGSTKHSYFSQLPHALRELSRLVANEECHDLDSWIKSIENTYRELEQLGESV